MKIRIWMSVISLSVILGLYQNCSEVAFSENPIVYKSDTVTFDTSDLLGAEFYKVVLVLDPSSSMNDDLVKLSAALDRVIETARGYNIRFYVYNTNSNARVQFSGNNITVRNDGPSNLEVLSNATFNLMDGSSMVRPISNFSLTDWSSYEYKFQLKNPLAVFELTKNSSNADINNTKASLQNIVNQTFPIGVNSNEFGICTIRRILSETGDSRIIFPGDKVNFILISDENNSGIVDTDTACTSGGTVVKADSTLQDDWCVQDFKGSGGQRSKQNAKNCNDGYDINSLTGSTAQMTIGTTLGIIEDFVGFTYINVDTIVSEGLPKIVNYNYESIVSTETSCTPDELSRVRAQILSRTGRAIEPSTCFRRRQNNGFTFSGGSFTISRSSVTSAQHLSLINETYRGKHCNADSTFFDSVNQRSYPSYRHVLAERLASSGATGVDPTKIAIGSCVQKLSINHLGEGLANPLVFLTSVSGSHTYKYFNDIKTSANLVLDPENYVISSFHHSSNLDQGLCVLDPSVGSFGTSQDQLITSLGANGYRESICSSDYSRSLVQFASRFIKDQNRTFTLTNYRQGTEILSIKINNNEIVGINGSYRMIGNRIVISEGYINQGDMIDVEFRYPLN